MPRPSCDVAASFVFPRRLSGDLRLLPQLFPCLQSPSVLVGGFPLSRFPVSLFSWDSGRLLLSGLCPQVSFRLVGPPTTLSYVSLYFSLCDSELLLRRHFRFNDSLSCTPGYEIIGPGLRLVTVAIDARLQDPTPTQAKTNWECPHPLVILMF
ncbi:hypothetical protein NDU88_003044 [Pleurodeles waltl]|uniref:Uncharacterized protein n=1 Tax=Pleurodeles waltl TaxID=8319 RepID=A0AAV7SCC1_PLEWA|nr:hypothetical protein NDU88_003044 [Pleurodeles waltl]